MLKKQPNICILFHCVSTPTQQRPVTHPELFVPYDDIRAIIIELKELGYRFTLPWLIPDDDTPNCIISFDDGYYNNVLFLPLAKELDLPFILFPNSYNITTNTPYLWDIKELQSSHRCDIYYKDYLKEYNEFVQKDYKELLSDTHRPFSTDEFSEFANNPHTHLGVHSHSHSPFSKGNLSILDREIEQNIDFLKQFRSFRKRELSLPCGVYSRSSLHSVKDRFDRIYTIEGGKFNLSSKIVHRISLINPEIGGTLSYQIERSFGLKLKTKRLLSLPRRVLI
ncbi:MAG: polysaccharide deacetylase family protein [Bacteriovoracaceae bacterium]|nr:polysaccharide deacetylase family protein [Bacteriovoracaceae bacterium]